MASCTNASICSWNWLSFSLLRFLTTCIFWLVRYKQSPSGAISGSWSLEPNFNIFASIWGRTHLTIPSFTFAQVGERSQWKVTVGRFRASAGRKEGRRGGDLSFPLLSYASRKKWGQETKRAVAVTLRTQAPWPAVLWEPHVEPVLIPGLIVGKSTPVAQSGSDGLQSFCSRGDPPNLGQPGLCVTVLYFKAERRKHLISLVSLVFWKKKKKERFIWLYFA